MPGHAGVFGMLHKEQIMGGTLLEATLHEHIIEDGQAIVGDSDGAGFFEDAVVRELGTREVVGGSCGDEQLDAIDPS